MKRQTVTIKTTYKPGKMQEFGWLAPEWHAETVTPHGFGAFNGRSATEQGAIYDLLWKIKNEKGIEIKRCPQYDTWYYEYSE